MGSIVSECLRLAAKIQKIADQVRINKRHSQHLAWRMAIVSDVLALAQEKFPSEQLQKVDQLTTLKKVLEEGERLLSEFEDKRWFSRIRKRGDDCESFLGINRKLDASMQALSLELALGKTFQEFNPVRVAMDDEEDAEKDSLTVAAMQAAETNEAFKQMLAEWKEHLETKQNLSQARRAAVKARELKRGELTKGRRIGQGGFGVVYEGRWQGTPVAIKELPYGSELSAEEKRAFRDEAACHADLRHPHVVLVLGTCTNESPFQIVMELMRGGSLLSLIRDKVRGMAGFEEMPFPIAVAQSIMLQIARAMVFLHSRGIIHRDLKAANVLVNVLDGATGACTVKVADFGLATVKTATSLHRTRASTCRWMAPEISDDQPYSEKSDVFSFAMTCVEVLCGTPPFYDLKSESAVIKAVDRGVRPRLPKSCPAVTRALVDECWKQDHSARPDFREICTRLEEMGAREVPEPLFEKGGRGSDVGLAQSSPTSPLNDEAEFVTAPYGTLRTERPGQSSPTTTAQGIRRRGVAQPQSSSRLTESPEGLYLLACQSESVGNQAQALRYYTLAAEQGLPKAQLEMGHRYLVGNGVAVDQKLAFNWFQIAAKQGDAGAQFVLARCFALGRGTACDHTRASHWYARAVASWGLSDVQKWFLQHPSARLGEALQVDAFRLPLLQKIFGMKHVNLAACSSGAKALAAALASRSFRALETQTLDLGYNQFGEAGAKALAAALERGSFPALRTLNLGNNYIGSAGAGALAAASRAQRNSVPNFILKF